MKPVLLIFTALVAAVVMACSVSGGRQENNWVVVVLGAQIQMDPVTQRVVPAFHTLSRTAAAAIYFRKVNPTQQIVLSGGYNVGIRYDLNGNIYPQANFTFAAFSEARWKGPSESSVMASVLTAPPYNIPLEFISLEETSATTEENAKVTSVMLKRTYFNGTRGVAVCSNLYHLATALPLFRANLPADVAVQGLFAEDWLALDGTQDWITPILAYYSKPAGGRLWDAQRIGQIMLARKAGDLSVSVAQLL